MAPRAEDRAGRRKRSNEHPRQLLWMRKRDRTDDERVDNREHRRRDADCQAEHAGGRKKTARPGVEASHGVPAVMPDRTDPGLEVAPAVRLREGPRFPDQPYIGARGAHPQPVRSVVVGQIGEHRTDAVVRQRTAKP